MGSWLSSSGSSSEAEPQPVDKGRGQSKLCKPRPAEEPLIEDAAKAADDKFTKVTGIDLPLKKGTVPDYLLQNWASECTAVHDCLKVGDILYGAFFLGIPVPSPSSSFPPTRSPPERMMNLRTGAGGLGDVCAYLTGMQRERRRFRSSELVKIACGRG